MMRTRPPDLTEREVASSNTALNAVFGSRQKSWMTGASGIVRPSPRPVPGQRVQSTADVIPSPAASDESSPVQQQKSPVNITRMTLSPAQRPPLTELPPQSQPFEHHPLERLEEVHSHAQRNPPPWQQPEQQHVPQPQPSPQYQQPFTRPRHVSPEAFTVLTSSPTVSYEQAPATSPVRRGRPPKRPRLNLDQSTSIPGPPVATPSNVPSLKPRIPVIDEHIRSTGGVGNLNASLERPRFILLRDACNNEDIFYVVLHQMFCLWSLDRDKLHHINGLAELGFGDATRIAAAFQILGQLIRENDLISQLHLKWFSEFPSPMETLLSTSTLYRQSVSHVCTFLTNLAPNWQNLKHKCASRHYPPLVDEMVDRLGLLSPVLHGVFFTATRRNLGVGDDESGAQMEKLFLQDREGHRELAARYNTAYPPTAKEFNDRNSKLIKMYLHFYKNRTGPGSQQPNAAHSSGSNSGTPILGSTRLPQSDIQQNSVFLNGSHHMNSPVQGEDVSGHGHFQNVSMAGGGPMPSPSTAFRLHSHSISQLSPKLSTPLRSPLQQSIPQSNPNVLRSSYPPAGQDHSFPMTATEVARLAQHQQQHQIASRISGDMAAQQYHNHVQGAQHQNSQQATQHQPSRLPSTASQQRHQQLQSQGIQQSASQQQQAHRAASIVSQHAFEGQSPTQPPASQVSTFNGPWPNTNASSIDLRFHNPSAARSVNISAITNRPMVSNPPSARSISTYSPSMGSAPAVRAVPQYRFQQKSIIPDHDLLIPQHGVAIAPHAPNPDMTALHQSHLRSPILITKNLPGPRRYYQAIRTCAMGPVILPRDLMLSTYEFKVSKATFMQIAKDTRTGPEAPICRELELGSLQFRLRCVQLERGTSEIKLVNWVVADTYWPPSMFVEFNGNIIDFRRKNLHAKDLPVDVTPHVNSAGVDNPNHIRISLSRPGRTHKEYYGVAVEVIEILEHQQILDMCLKDQRIPAEQTLNNIKTSLSGLADDDEISMVVSDLTIDLADPFMAKIFDIPVRGSSCLHRECFDLETFLITRISKAKRPGQPSMVDVWKCPLCGKDARPYSLRVDDFLVSVRNDLAERQILDTKAIIISADGTWVPKVEPQRQKRTASKAGFGDDSDDDESEIEQQVKSTIAMAQVAPTKKTDIEIIELDDD